MKVTNVPQIFRFSTSIDIPILIPDRGLRVTSGGSSQIGTQVRDYPYTDDYQIGKVVGSGASGDVFQAKLKKSAKWMAAQKDVVLKTLPKSNISAKKLEELVAESTSFPFKTLRRKMLNVRTCMYFAIDYTQMHRSMSGALWKRD